MNLASLDLLGLSSFLLSKDFSQSVVESFKENEIDGQLFLIMNNDHLKEVAPKLVDRIKLQKLQQSNQVR